MRFCASLVPPRVPTRTSPSLAIAGFRSTTGSRKSPAAKPPIMTESALSALSPPCTAASAAHREQHPSRHAAHVLDPAVLPDHVDALYRAAWALSGSRADAEDLV